MAAPQPFRALMERLAATPAWPAVYVARWVWLFYTELRQDLAFVRAAGMAYATVIALVPSLVLVTALAGAIGVLGTHPETTIRAALHPLFGQVPTAGTFLVDGLLQVDLRSLSAIALIGLLLVSARLFLSIELAYHDILGQEVKRSWPHRLLHYYFAITFVPLAVLVAIRASLEGAFAPGGGSWAFPLVGRLSLFCVLIGALKLLPSTTIRWAAAAGGASVSFALIEIGRLLFEAYVRIFGAEDPLLAIYGSIALFPVFLLWVYLIWVFVLLGVEVANVIENHSTLSEAEFEADEVDRFPTVELAVQVAALVGAQFHNGRGATTLDDLTAEIRVPARHLRPVIAALERAGLLVSAAGGYLLTKPAQNTQVGEVVALWYREAAPRLEVGDPCRADFIARLSSEESVADAARRWSRRPLPPAGEP